MTAPIPSLHGTLALRQWFDALAVAPYSQRAGFAKFHFAELQAIVYVDLRATLPFLVYADFAGRPMIKSPQWAWITFVWKKPIASLDRPHALEVEKGLTWLKQSGSLYDLYEFEKSQKIKATEQFGGPQSKFFASQDCEKVLRAKIEAVIREYNLELREGREENYARQQVY